MTAIVCAYFDSSPGLVAVGKECKGQGISNVKMELTGDLSVNDIVADNVIPDMHVIQKIKLRSEF